MTRKTLAFLFLSFFVLSERVVFAQDENEASNDWEFTLQPFVYFAQANGEVQFNRLLKGELSDEFETSGGLYFEAHSDKWSIVSDWLFLNYKADFTLPVSSRVGDYKGNYITGSIFGLYHATSWLSVGLGFKAVSLDSEVTIPTQGSAPEVNQSFTYWVFPPLIAARFKIINKEKFHLGIQGDYGGFGVYGTNTFFINPYASYRFGQLTSIGLSYRYLDINIEDDDDGSVTDIAFSGPQLLIGIHF